MKLSLPYSLKLNVKKRGKMKKEIREIMMRVYLTKNEYQQVIDSSTRAGLSISSFARAVCLGSKVESREDAQARRELGKIASDLGRLGGLLKLGIVGTNQAEDFRPLLKQIDERQLELKAAIKRI